MSALLPFAIDSDFLETLKRDVASRGRAAGSDGVDPELLSALQLILLRQTVEHAYDDVSFYRRVMDERGVRPDDLLNFDAFRRFPIMSRDAVELNREQLVARNAKVVGVRSTSGTTRGHSLPVFVGEDELVCAELWHEILAGGKQADGAAKDIVLHVKPAVQRIGSACGSRRQQSLQMAATYNIDGPAPFRMDVGYEDFIIQQLFESFSIPNHRDRINVLRCVPPFLFSMLTAAMVRRNIDPRKTDVRTILLAGGTVAAEHRALAKEKWDAEIASAYSCAEIRGVAKQTGADLRVYSFGIDVFAEIVSEDLLSPVALGEDGLLVLTSLAPFQTTQPFLRYLVGDVVTYLGDAEDGLPGFTFRYRGRRQQCPSLEPLIGAEGRNRVVGTAEIESALASFPEIPADFAPRFRIEITADGLLTHVESLVVVSESWAHDLGDRIANAIRAEVIAARPEWKWPVKVRLYPKGMLKDAFRLYPAR